jgi:paired amphipathic helix protein Sin3a
MLGMLPLLPSHLLLHRSFYFKQSDKKGLLPKSMLAEVREAADKRRADERNLRSLSLGCPLSDLLQADLTYEYGDR